MFIKGEENYIKNINKNLENWAEDSNIKIIDCYNIEEISEKIDEVMGGYKKILKTSGEVAINN